MKKIILIIIIFSFSFVDFSFAKAVNPDKAASFNYSEPQQIDADNADVMPSGFDSDVVIESDEQEIENVEEKYKEYTVKLDDSSSSASRGANTSGALFILGAEKVQYKNPYEDEIQANNMFWDKSNNFRNIYFQDYKNISPMPMLINASYLVNSIDSKTKVFVGQSSLSDFNDTPVYFVRANETTFDNGFKIATSTKNLNLSAGSYNSTLNNRLSGGAVVSTNPFKIPKINGSFVVGSGYYSNELDNDNKNTGGLFGEYRYKRLKLNAQAAKSKYANSSDLETGLYFTPEFQLTDSISIKTRFVKNITQDTNQDEIGLSYKPKKHNSRDFEFEINAANTRSQDSLDKQRVRFTAKFKI